MRLIEIHHYHHYELPASVNEQFSHILTRLEVLRLQGVRIMADVTSIKKLVSDLNDETNAVAAKLDAETKQIADLQAQIAAGTPVTAQDLQDIQDGLQPISDRLKSLGADASQPIPPPM